MLRDEVTRLFAQLRPEIKQLVERHLDRRIRRRIGASDVVQSAFLDANDRLARFLCERPMAVRSWLFFLAKMKTLETNQHHLASQKRSAKREAEYGSGVDKMSDRASSPSQVLSKQETQQRLLQCIELLPTHYRQVIELRHINSYTNQEVSEILKISQNAASKLYIRAVGQLQRKLASR